LAQPNFAWLSPIIQTPETYYSTITKVEVLDFHRLNDLSKRFFETYFDSIQALPIEETVIKEAILLKQQQKMALGDAIIGATALVHQMELYTHNVQDFKNIRGLRLKDPISER
jgi:predicted nucleic acid-binding protein